ncbi:MAG: type II toxin-antitoxin system VapC family toxin [Bacteroidales bacterium]|jgi:PIN domain nuclease of toxin-antitoxin system|nr:type II toxin-antitoxin system VapC family toxin [Bacteroidales bacterium]
MAVERYLPDTNATIFAISNPNRLNKNIREYVNYGLGFVSIISMQEIGVLITLGKIKIRSIKNLKDIIKFTQSTGLEILPYETRDLNAFYDLPYLPENKDPFDRAIVAHAISQHCTLISSDSKLEKYRPILKLLSI